MKGYQHEVWLAPASDPNPNQHGWVDKNFVAHRHVRMTNGGDEFYVQVFETRDEVEALIAELRKAADEAFGPSTAPSPE